MRTFDPISPEETVTLTLDFTADLESGETLTGPATVVISVASGTDSSVATRLNGAASIIGNYVLQSIMGCLAGVNYNIVASCKTSLNRVLAIGGRLDCVPAYLQ